MGFRTNSMALKVQKKVVGKLTHRGLVRRILPGGSLDAFDHFYNVLYCYYSQVESEKVSELLDITVEKQEVIDDNLPLLLAMQENMRNLFKTVQSFHQLQHSYSKSFLSAQLDEAEESLLNVVNVLLSPKSKDRVRFVFQHLHHPQMMEHFFEIGGKHEHTREKFIDAIDLIIP